METRKKKLNKTDWATASSSPDCTYFADPSFSSTKEVSCVIHAIGMKYSLYVKEGKRPVFSHSQILRRLLHRRFHSFSPTIAQDFLLSMGNVMHFF